MTRKDYVAIAQAFKLAHVPNASAETQASLFELAGRLANILALDNPRFDRERFLVACGVAQ